MEIPGKWAYKLRKDELPQGHPPTPKERKYIAADGVSFLQPQLILERPDRAGVGLPGQRMGRADQASGAQLGGMTPGACPCVHLGKSSPENGEGASVSLFVK